jgi:hypothetical protein
MFCESGREIFDEAFVVEVDGDLGQNGILKWENSSNHATMMVSFVKQ